jgi:predicted RNase H-like nuclease
MKVVLDIDAAWTQGEPSGCAVVISSGSAWQRLDVEMAAYFWWTCNGAR